MWFTLKDFLDAGVPKESLVGRVVYKHGSRGEKFRTITVFHSSEVFEASRNHHETRLYSLKKITLEEAKTLKNYFSSQTQKCNTIISYCAERKVEEYDKFDATIAEAIRLAKKNSLDEATAIIKELVSYYVE